MKFNNCTFLLLLSVLASGCAILKDPEITRRGEIDKYSFVVLPIAASLSSSSGGKVEAQKKAGELEAQNTKQRLANTVDYERASNDLLRVISQQGDVELAKYREIEAINSSSNPLVHIAGMFTIPFKAAQAQSAAATGDAAYRTLASLNELIQSSARTTDEISTKLTEASNASLTEVYGNQYGVYGSTSSKEINPSKIIEGILLKRGLISTDTVTSESKDKTLIVKYGESGRRDVAGGLGGYTLEVTITIVTAKTNEVVYSCTAEGQGSTEVDDIREAIHRCLSGL
jgi:hypothetical protein